LKNQNQSFFVSIEASWLIVAKTVAAGVQPSSCQRQPGQASHMGQLWLGMIKESTNLRPGAKTG
jgi:hypothetical protein